MHLDENVGFVKIGMACKRSAVRSRLSPPITSRRTRSFVTVTLIFRWDDQLHWQNHRRAFERDTIHDARQCLMAVGLQSQLTIKWLDILRCDVLNIFEIITLPIVPGNLVFQAGRRGSPNVRTFIDTERNYFKVGLFKTSIMFIFP